MANLYTPESLLYQNYLRGNNTRGGHSDFELDIEISFDITITTSTYVIDEEEDDIRPIFRQI